MTDDHETFLAQEIRRIAKLIRTWSDKFIAVSFYVHLHLIVINVQTRTLLNNCFEVRTDAIRCL